MDVPIFVAWLAFALTFFGYEAFTGVIAITLENHIVTFHLCYNSPEHRAALYEVAANFPGVDYEGSVTDPAGRRGVSVSYEGGGTAAN
jgi:hypothetical protein